jgi:hypothetical protein
VRVLVMSSSDLREMPTSRIIPREQVDARGRRGPVQRGDAYDALTHCPRKRRKPFSGTSWRLALEGRVGLLEAGTAAEKGHDLTTCCGTLFAWQP